MFNNIKLAITTPLICDINKSTIYKTSLNLILKEKAGFTLAETLITLTIIGVIAAMTVPTLMTNYQKQVYVTGLKKAYSQLSHIVKMIPLENNCSHGDYQCALDKFYAENTEANENGTNYFVDGGIQLLAPHFKTIKTVTSQEGGQICESLAYAANGGCIYTADGMMYGSSHGMVISVDVNAEKGPNRWGRDRFRFYVTLEPKNGITEGTLIPAGSILDGKWRGVGSPARTICTSESVATRLYDRNGPECTAQVLEEGKMDY